MRRTSIAFALSTLLLASICSAQQTASTSQHTAPRAGNPANTTTLVGGPDTVVNCVQAQVGRIAMFTAATLSSVILCNSGIYEALPYGTGAIGILNPHPIAALDVTGNINSSMAYQIGGNSVLNEILVGGAYAGLGLGLSAGINNTAGSHVTYLGNYAGLSNTSGGDNTFVGESAGQNNTTGSFNTFFGMDAAFANTTGAYNTISGSFAGNQNTTGSLNTFYGYQAGGGNTTGSRNTGIGWGAGPVGYPASGSDNTFVGTSAGGTSTGSSNTYVGSDAGTSNTAGIINTAIGASAAISITTGQGNTIVGGQAGSLLTTGFNNTLLGVDVGHNIVAGSNNLYLAGGGLQDESNTIRIGGSVNTAAYIAGIYGSTSSGGIPVYVNSDGQLGTLTSSLRFKEQVRDMGDGTSALMKLRPVTFLYKPEYSKGERTMQYGLIAEEVAKVYPELVAYDDGGQPYTVRYQYITTMLLNEVQKQYHRAEAEAKVITTQEQRIDELEQRLSRLERLVPQTVAQK
jgi:hypothetical protein